MPKASFFHPLGDCISFANGEEFSQKILSIDFDVGASRKTSDFRERYTLGQFLLTLWSKDRLKFPVTIKKHETPDLIWQQEEGEVGVEITEGTTQSYRRGVAIHNRRSPGQLFFPSDLSDTASPRGGWFGQNAEIEWINIMIGAAVDKAEGYIASAKPFDNMELLIYSNSPGGNGLEFGDFPQTRNLLIQRLNETNVRNIVCPIFRAVNVVYGSDLIMDIMGETEIISPPQIRWRIRNNAMLGHQIEATDIE